MNTKWINDIIDYDGSQLHSGWIESQTGLTGDTLAAFIGQCDVKPEHMVDLEDLSAGLAIRSNNMLHFIGEFTDRDLEKAVLKQRLLISQIQQLLSQYCPTLSLFRIGNDLYESHTYKMTISVATTSDVSTLLHAGINIESEGTPVPTKGLHDLNIPPRQFAQEILKEFEEEMKGLTRDLTKVKKVP